MQAKELIVAISGASGFGYALRLVECLLGAGVRVHLLVSDAAREVSRLEMDWPLPEGHEPLKQALVERLALNESHAQNLCLYDKRDWTSPVASGSAPIDGMIICPCSTGTLAAVANGMSTNLIERAATVCLKEHRRMVIVPRETPVSAIQLEHMHKLAQLGVRVLPASPGFYHKPESVDDLIDFIVARILQQVDLPQDLIKPWGSQHS
ncbi:Flavin prenyltransferase UbiX [BD1-7 clade bacterium]|uniref:Flavin prenyltransferase UbiX n=1 Tax=BD1-7 clade bacterium TaxID=2029982 RepID=A0A5S9QRJ3_9GAMM|nr:Flavin prenyltransferase UbiX [BD1-7 clade bacterium]CAA0121305.1 Flavin prenyltransferase UbiX [BD1-7 clade bacterium]